MSITPYKDLDSLGRKARDASKRLNCEKCPAYKNRKYNTFVCGDVCDYVFMQGFRKGYNKRKSEEKK